MDNGKTAALALIPATAASIFPDSAELYDSMAEIHVMRARKSYERAPEVDPGSEHSNKMLKRLKRP